MRRRLTVPAGSKAAASDAELAPDLHAKAESCRSLSRNASDERDRRMCNRLANEYDGRAVTGRRLA
jgi:hypothetical protein